MIISQSRKQLYRGFTLLEVVISLSILAMLTSSILLISQTALQFSQTIIDNQDRQLHAQEVEDHMERHLWELTPNSRISLTIDEGNQNVQTLSIIRPDHYFPLNGKDVLAGETVFAGSFDSSGYLDLIQYHYASGEDEFASNLNDNPDQQTLLFEDLITLQWHFYDQFSAEWLSEWDQSQGIPTRVRLVYQHVDSSITSSHVVWLPPSLSAN